MADGAHWIAGEAVTTGDTFPNAPVSGDPQHYPKGTPALVDQAVQAAETALLTFAETTRFERAALLDAIADEIEARGAALTAIATAETGLPEARIDGERGRTNSQLRLFARHLEAGDYLDVRHDPALPDRKPLPRPDLRLIQRPLGPVAVFGASNFPLAFSVAGGDTASALAAGCPVVVKGHPAHPGTSALVSEAISAAVAAKGMPGGVFSMVQDGGFEVGQALVTHPLITAVGFTGSLRGGRALYDLAAARPVPVPFYGELGSVNPMFLLPHAVAARGEAIAKGWAGSLTTGAGQFCTNPGVAVMIDGPGADELIAAMVEALGGVPAQVMLTDGIAAAFRDGAARMAAAAQVLTGAVCAGRSASPWLLQVTGDEWLANPDLSHEVFGPLGIVVRVRDAAQMTAVATGLEGQLSATLHIDEDDYPLARTLLPLLERKAGRVLANGYPTGVEVAESMVHSGPYPATTNASGTSVGTMAIRRWLRPICYQNMPEALLPAELQQR